MISEADISVIHHCWPGGGAAQAPGGDVAANSKGDWGSELEGGPMTVFNESKIKEQHDQNQRTIKDIDALASKGKDRGKLTRMLGLFIKRLRVHCENEEKVMMMKGYKYLPSHKTDHARIFETLGLVVQVCNDKKWRSTIKWVKTSSA